MTVPQCYPSVVCNTLEVIAHGISEVGVVVHIVIDSMVASCLMRGGTHVDTTSGTKVTVIVTAGLGAMADDAVIKAVRGVGDGVPLIDIREMVSMGGGNVNMGTRRAGRGWRRRESMTWSNV